MNNQIQKKNQSKHLIDVILPFVIGGVSGCTATCFVQPMDLIKIRIQLKSEKLGSNAGKQISPIQIVRDILKEGGYLYFWKGIDSALVRQMFYTTTRMGIYKTLYGKQKAMYGREPTLFEKSQCSLAAGFFGAVAGNPADLALVRIQADNTLPVQDRRGYRNVFDAFYKIVRDEGFLALWRGATPTIVKAMVINVAVLGPYDEIKEKLNKYYGTNDAKYTRLLASAIAGFLSSFTSLPFDNAKTKLQKMKKDNIGKYPYASIFDAIAKTVKREGFKDFGMAPHTMITLLTQDWLTDHIKQLRQ